MKQTTSLFLAVTLAFTLSSCGEKKAEESNEGAQTTSENSNVIKGDAAHGQQVYAQTCTPCHGPGGKGDGPAAATLNPKPADHTNKELIGARTDKDLANIIKMGGGVVGKPTMPAAPQLSDADVADVISYLRQLSGSEHH